MGSFQVSRCGIGSESGLLMAIGFLTQAQKASADAYHAHHFSCSSCTRGGRDSSGRRCAAGLVLWTAYQSADAAEGAPLAGKVAAAVADQTIPPPGNHGDNLRSERTGEQQCA